MYCKYCGQELDLNNKCHNEFCPSVINNVSPSINGISEGELVNFLGKRNTNYYLNVFFNNSNNSKFVSWNFSAFIFQWIWMFYRKMNSIATIYLLTYLIGLIFLSPVTFIILSTTCHILCGLFGNALYKNHCLKRISSLKVLSERVNPDSYGRMLQYHGGTSVIVAIVMSVLYVFSLLILLLLYVATSIDYINYPDNYNNPYNYYEDEDSLPYWYNNPGNNILPTEDSGSYI